MTGDWDLFTYWRNSPWTIKAYAYIQIASLVFYIATRNQSEVRSEPFAGAVIFTVLLSAFSVYWVIRRSRAMRIVLLVLLVPTILNGFGVFFGRSPYPVWIGVSYLAAAAIEVGFLLHPLTRQWCDRRLRLTDPERSSRTRP